LEEARARIDVPDEEALAQDLPAEDRRALGAWFTPAALVAQVIAHAKDHLPKPPVRVVDPACGAGAFLVGAQAAFPSAALLGVELSPDSAAHARARLPGARIVEGDALRGGLRAALGPASRGWELWIGNPPYNGTSALLRDPLAYAELRALLPKDFALPPGTSLRDDFAFFLLVAADRLSRQKGVLAFITSATLLDAFLYAPLRRFLLERLSLCEVLALPAGTFEETRVRACVTIWRSRSPAKVAPLFRTLGPKAEGFPPGPAVPLTPEAPDFALRPVEPEAAALDARWREDGEPITELLPISFPGLKTRFDELLTDSDPDRLLARVDAFLRCSNDRLEPFAASHALPPKTWAKLAALKANLPKGCGADASRVRPFFRYAGAKHRGQVPASARAYCYLDRALIPRGDHRLRGGYDPHRGEVKLLFNVRELPLSAALLTEEGCVHDHRHARFAPLHVPARILTEGLGVTRYSEALGPLVPNLSEKGRAMADRLGGPRALYERLVAFVNSKPVQEVWAPAFGAHRALPVPSKLEKWT
jgi:hypothetical protein